MWSEDFEIVLRRYLTMPADRPLAQDDSLEDLGLDSMGAVSAMLDLEQTFSVRFTGDQLGSDTFATPASLWAAVSALLVSTR